MFRKYAPTPRFKRHLRATKLISNSIIDEMVFHFKQVILDFEDHIAEIESLGEVFSIDDFSRKADKKIRKDCEAFLRKASKYSELIEDCPDLAGADFYMSRQGFGTGFYDHIDVYGEKGAEKLEDIANSFKPIVCVVNDDGEIDIRDR